MINVTLVTNSGDGMPKSLSVTTLTTIEDILNMHLNGHLDDFRVTVRSDGGTSRQVAGDCLDCYVQEGDRITVVPRKVEGE